MLTIRQRYDKNIKKLNKIRAELEALQVECPHADSVGEYKSNTGNYDPSADCYWIDARCLDCGRWWIIDSEDQKHEYHTFPGRIIK